MTIPSTDEPLAEAKDGEQQIGIQLLSKDGVATAAITATSVTFADRVWAGGTGDWYDAGNWTTTSTDPSSYPLAGDTATVGSGTAMLLGTEAKDAGTFDTNDVTLGSTASGATLDLVRATVDPLFKITTAGNAELLSTGTSSFTGTLTAAVDGATLTLASEPIGADVGSLVFNQAGFVVSGNETVEIAGNVTFEAHSGNVTEPQNGNVPDEPEQGYIALPGSLVNNGMITTIQQYVEVGGGLSGTGTYNLRFETTLNAMGSVSSGQTIDFGLGDSRLDIGDVANFAGKITNFRSGNFIDLTNVGSRYGTTATYDAASQTLAVSDDFSGQTIAQVHNLQAASGTLVTYGDGGNGTIVSYADSPSSIDISAADRAMHSDIARTLDVPGTATHIDGAGIKIGIISDSFDVTGVADGNAASGYLPSNPNGTSAVAILKEGPNDGSDEGQAMAELVHQVAPGAQIYFAKGIDGEADFADSIAKLKAAGCQIIVDDIGYSAEAQHQMTGTLPRAVGAAVDSGVNYFTSAGNDRQNFLEQAFAPSSTILSDGTAVAAHVFSNGTAYEPIRIRGGANIEVQWSAPFEGVNGTGAPNALQAKLFDAGGNLVATSTQVVEENGVATADADLFVPDAYNYGSYKLAVYGTDGIAVPSAFSVAISGAGHAAIYDPAVGQGSGNINGKGLIPGVNTVGAVFYGDSPAFGQTPSSENFSSYGPGQLTYDSQGNPLTTPVSLAKPDFAAPDGVTTSVYPFEPFFGTSAAAPDAAAVGALMLQADGRLINKQVTFLLEESAVPFDNSIQGGAGLIQADKAVSGAIAAATTPIWTAQAGTTSWRDAGNWSDDRTPDAGDDVTIGNGIGAIAGAYSVVYDLPSGTIGSLLIDGASAFAPAAMPTFSIAAGASLSAQSFSLGTGALDLAGSFLIAGGADSTGAITFNGTAMDRAVLTLAAFAQPFQGGRFDGTLDDFGFGDALDLESLTSATVAYVDGTMTVSGLDPSTGQVRVETFTLTDPGAAAYYAHDDGNSGTLVDAVAVCFAAGTLIRTSRGDVALEHLLAGDILVTASGAHRSICWLGSRTLECRRHPRPHEVMPVRIAAHAFGENRPARNLRVSPGHAICVDMLGEVLIPAAALINGTTIVQEQVDRVTYYHVELDSHDVILAENLPCESYLEMGNRSFFAGVDVIALDASPDAPVPTHADFCRPFHAEGPTVAFVRERLAACAIRQGWRLVENLTAGVHLMVDGRRVEPEIRDLAARFLVPAGAESVWLVSDTAMPANVDGTPDDRALGVCVSRIVVDDGFATREVAADDLRLSVGFHAIEPGPQRWTAGRARLPADLWDGVEGDFFLRVDLALLALPQWVAQEEARQPEIVVAA